MAGGSEGEGEAACEGEGEAAPSMTWMELLDGRYAVQGQAAAGWGGSWRRRAAAEQ